MRSLDGDLAEHVDFFYTVEGEPPFSEEIREIAARHASLHAHLIDTAVDGRLNTEQVLAAAGDADGLSVFMCGPEGMLRAFQVGLVAAGVPSRRIHRECSTGGDRARSGADLFVQRRSAIRASVSPRRPSSQQSALAERT